MDKYGIIGAQGVPFSHRLSLIDMLVHVIVPLTAWALGNSAEGALATLHELGQAALNQALNLNCPPSIEVSATLAVAAVARDSEPSADACARRCPLARRRRGIRAGTKFNILFNMTFNLQLTFSNTPQIVYKVTG